MFASCSKNQWFSKVAGFSMCVFLIPNSGSMLQRDARNAEGAMSDSESSPSPLSKVERAV